jgi:hypothetical protein
MDTFGVTTIATARTGKAQTLENIKMLIRTMIKWILNRRKKMKVLVEDKGEGLVGLIGQRVTFFTMNYIYSGKLVGVNTRDIKLEDAGIVYETGAFTDLSWRDYQKLPQPIYVRLNSVEAYSVIK